MLYPLIETKRQSLILAYDLQLIIHPEPLFFPIFEVLYTVDILTDFFQTFHLANESEFPSTPGINLTIVSMTTKAPISPPR